MADNVAITPGTGDTVAADDIGTVKYQRIKITPGADGTSEGDVSTTNQLPVNFGNLAKKIDDTTTTDVVYIGRAAIGSSGASAVWQIKKIDSSTIAGDTTWADGNANYDNIWDNRATSVTYS